MESAVLEKRWRRLATSLALAVLCVIAVTMHRVLAPHFGAPKSQAHGADSESPGPDLRSDQRSHPIEAATISPSIASAPTTRQKRPADLRGLVYDAVDRRPIAGARVGSNRTFVRKTKTDAHGRFELESIDSIEKSTWPQKTRTICVEAEGYARTHLRIPEFASDLTVDLLMRRGDTACGVIVAGDRPLANARVVAIGVAEECFGSDVDFAQTWTRSDGLFVLESMRRDVSHVLIADAPGRGRATIEFAPRSGEAGLLDLGTIALPTSRSIVGRAETLDGVPLRGEIVSIRTQFEDGASPAGDFDVGIGRWGRGASTESDVAGEFRFDDLTPDEYILTLQLPGRPLCSLAVTLTSELDLEGVVLRADPGSELRLRIVDTRGKGVPNASFSTPKFAIPWQTDADGRAILKGLNKTPHRFTVHLYQTNLAVEPFEGIPGGPEIVRIAHATDRITGTLVDPNGASLPWVQVIAIGEYSRPTWFTGPDGSFELRARVGERVALSLTGRRLDSSKGRFVEVESHLEATLPDVIVPSKDLRMIAREPADDR